MVTVERTIDNGERTMWFLIANLIMYTLLLLKSTPATNVFWKLAFLLNALMFGAMVGSGMVHVFTVSSLAVSILLLFSSGPMTGFWNVIFIAMIGVFVYGMAAV